MKFIPKFDDLSEKAAAVLRACKSTGVHYKGHHRCSCGATSDSTEHITPNGLITNSLLHHYVACHRDQVPRTEIAKLLCEAMDIS